MKVEQIQRDIERSDSFQERSMGLAVGSEAFVFNVLRKDLYSDPIGSLIREYTVNAQDEHRKHSKADKPILIQVPNRFSPELHIRDFAGGLTEEQVFEFFGNYGASDKRDSNLAVGFFGLGCKSAFAYTDSYVVKSFKDGKAFTFNIYIDETEIGRVAKISEEDTTEPNGVLVIVPVKTHDTDEFQRKVISTVSHFKVKPTIEGLAYEPTFGEKKVVISGEGWEYFGNGSAKVIMGEIAYPIDYYAMGSDCQNWERELLRSDLHIACDIGEVQVTASREALQMSPKTIAAIRARLVTIKKVMITETQKAFVNAKNLFEAKAIYDSVMVRGSGYGHIIRDSGDKIVWKGQPLTDSYIRFADNSSHRVSIYTKDWKGRVKLTAGTSFKCKSIDSVYFDDTNGTKVNYKRRAVTLLEPRSDYHEAEVVIVHTNNIPDLEKFLGMKVTELKSYDAVTPTMPTSTRGAGKGIDLTKRTKHQSKVFVLNIDKTLNFYKGSASDCWDVKTVEVKGGVYIPIERFHPKLPTMYSIRDLSRQLDRLKSVGINVNVPIYGIKGTDKVDGLIRFDEWIVKKLESNEKLKREVSLVKTANGNSLLDVQYMKVSNLPDGTAKDYVTLYNEMLQAKRKTYSRILLDVYRNVEVDEDEKFLNLSEKMIEKYPMLSVVSSYNLGEPKVLDYIREREGV